MSSTPVTTSSRPIYVTISCPLGEREPKSKTCRNNLTKPVPEGVSRDLFIQELKERVAQHVCDVHGIIGKPMFSGIGPQHPPP